jgi:molybdopterin/thiamine biosynthesis adenylyltransferase/rhodanese-related sulfurtransferase
MSAKDRRIAELRNEIDEVSVSETLKLLDQGAKIIDVREESEISTGSPKSAIRVGRNYLEVTVEEFLPEMNQMVLVMCASGLRSLFAAESLLRLGYKNVKSVKGGFNAWKDAGLPFEIPRVLTGEQRTRYERHLLIPEVGTVGQLRLLDSRVLLIGAGGLGCPAGLYLAAAGVGTIGIIDHDVVDRSNLQRQVLHNEERIGVPKVVSAKAALEALNSSINIVTHQLHLNAANVDEIFSNYELVIDGSDNFSTRYLVNDACVQHGLPCVHGSIYRFEGQVSVFWPGRENSPGPCYRCIFPEPPPPELAPSCAEAGVLGLLPGTIGILEATEAVKILLGIGEPLVGRMILYDALMATFTELQVSRNPECQCCGSKRQFSGYEEIGEVCQVVSTDETEVKISA